MLIMNYKYNGIIEKQNYCVLSGSATHKVLKVWVGHVGNNKYFTIYGSDVILDVICDRVTVTNINTKKYHVHENKQHVPPKQLYQITQGFLFYRGN